MPFLARYYGLLAGSRQPLGDGDADADADTAPLFIECKARWRKETYYVDTCRQLLSYSGAYGSVCQQPQERAQMQFRHQLYQ